MAAVLLAPLVLAASLSFAGVPGALVAAALVMAYFFTAIFVLGRHDSTTLVSCFIALTVLIPSNLTIGSLGAAGSPPTVIGIAAFAWWMFSRLGSRESSEPMARGRQPVRIGIFLFGASILLGYAAAFSRQIPALEISGANRGMLEVFGLAGIGLLVADGTPDRERLDVLGRRLVFWVSVLAVLGVVQYLTKTTYSSIYAHLPGFTSSSTGPIDLGTRNGFVRVQATAASPIEFGLVMAATLPVAIHYALYAQRRRLSSWMAVLLIAVTIPMSGSRAGIVGFGAAFFVLFLGWSLPRRTSAVAALLGMFAFLPLVMPGRIGSLVGDLLHASSDPSVTHREQDLARSGFLLTRSIWFGRGFGTFIPSEFTPAGQPVASLDNQYLGSLIATGIVGLAALIMLLLIWFFTALGARRRGAEESTKDFGLVLAASSVVLIAGFYVFDVFSFDITANTMFVLLGMTGALWRLAPSDLLRVDLSMSVLADG